MQDRREASRPDEPGTKLFTILGGMAMMIRQVFRIKLARAGPRLPRPYQLCR
jgi:hypothetical protein